MTAFLNDVLVISQRAEELHRRQFMTTSLATLLEGHGYEFEKVRSTGWGGGEPDVVMAPASLRILRKALEEFEAELQARDLELNSFSGIQGIWRLLTEPLDKLGEYSRDPSACHLDGLEAYALAELLESSWKELLVMAREIDKEYSEPDTPRIRLG